MTRDEAKARRAELIRKRDKLVDQIAETDTASASISSSGGSKSFSNRSVEELRRKLKIVDQEIARLSARLGLAAPQGAIKTIAVRYVV